MSSLISSFRYAARPFGVVNANPAGGRLLDAYTAGVVLAVSLRLLFSPYAGPCMRIRRASDNAEQDIGFSGSNWDSAAAALFCGASSGYVSIWYDQSGRGINFVQSDPERQFQIVASGVALTELMTPGFQGGMVTAHNRFPANRQWTAFSRSWVSAQTNNTNFFGTETGGVAGGWGMFTSTTNRFHTQFSGRSRQFVDIPTSNALCLASLMDGNQTTQATAIRSWRGSTELTEGTSSGGYSQPALRRCEQWYIGPLPTTLTGNNVRTRGNILYGVALSPANIIAINALLA